MNGNLTVNPRGGGNARGDVITGGTIALNTFNATNSATRTLNVASSVASGADLTIGSVITDCTGFASALPEAVCAASSSRSRSTSEARGSWRTSLAFGESWTMRGPGPPGSRLLSYAQRTVRLPGIGSDCADHRRRRQPTGGAPEQAEL